MTTTSHPLTATRAYAVLKEHGFPRTFVERLLPDWWDNALLGTSAGSLQFAMILQQRLGLEVSFVEDGTIAVGTRPGPRRFKHRAGTRQEELQVAANIGLALARLGAFASSETYRPLPKSAVELAELVAGPDAVVDFSRLLAVLWEHGIPVLFLSELPRGCKRLTGMATVVDGRPVIVLGLKHQQRSRQLFVLAHELGHIQCGHVGEGSILIDEDIVSVSNAITTPATSLDSEEAQADAYALALIRRGATAQAVRLNEHHTSTTLAGEAFQLGQALRIDPGHLILSFAQERSQWPLASQAIEYYPDSGGALELIKNALVSYAQLDRLSEENREYLLAAQGFQD